MTRSSTLVGYTIFYRNPPEDWHQFSGILHPSSTSFTMSNLKCGTKYQFYIEGYNTAGSSGPSDMVSTITSGAGTLRAVVS